MTSVVQELFKLFEKMNIKILSVVEELPLCDSRAGFTVTD